MVVEISVGNVECKVETRLTIDQLAVLQKECSFKVDGGEFIANNYRRKFKWDGVRKLFNIQTRRFPIGLLDRVTQLLSGLGFEVIIHNNRIINETSIDIEADAACFGSRSYQRNAVLTSCLMGNGVIKVATGGGKTAIAGLTINELKKRTIFIVHTRDLMYQTIESFQRLFPNTKIGQIGDGVIEYADVTVATMQTLAILGGINKEKDYEKHSKYDEDGSTEENLITEQQAKEARFFVYADSVQCVMMDEVQIVSSKTASEVRLLFKHANYAFGYSASPWRDDGSDLMIEAAFGKRIVDITASELINLGYLVRPTIRIRETNYKVDIPSKMKYVDIYKKAIVENEARNQQIASDATSVFHQGMNTLILVTQIKHGNILKEIIENVYGCEVQFISGKSNMKTRKKAIQDMRDGKISLMIASTIADVGLDIPRLECIVEAGAGKSSVTALQRLGRIMRPFNDKSECLFITYRDTVRYIKDHIERKKLIWQTEPEFNIVDELNFT